MMIKINEKSTIRFQITLTDEAGDNHDISSVVSCRWQLSDISGNVINNRTFENGLITTPDIVLSGDDLATSGRDSFRILAVVIVYNSTTGSNLQATEEIRFKVVNMVNI